MYGGLILAALVAGTFEANRGSMNIATAAEATCAAIAFWNQPPDPRESRRVRRSCSLNVFFLELDTRKRIGQQQGVGL
ncbi:hypothetical protein [uncultured Methylobacterium sp.]|uniref:hypothetical protein n=1 Tax=uncultured Methylobacterium sp. TaxID=157278 RepID=UPI00259830D8|nr:hypothetical protein [uncultured Methylobacterium sp.]